MSNQKTVEKEAILQYGFGVRHIQFVMLFLCMVTIYITRVNISMAIVGMIEFENKTNFNANKNIPVFHWNEQIKSIILSSFFWGYLVMNLPAAIITHKYNNKVLLATVMTLNGIMALITPYCSERFDYKSVIVIRVIQGLLQGFIMPTMHNLLSKWAPPNERARAGAFVIGGMNFGIAVTMFASGYLMYRETGWPLIFYTSGFLAFLWVILWCFIGSNSPDSHPKISEDERNYIKLSLKHTADENMKMDIPWKSIFTSKPVWAIVFAHMGQNWGMWTCLTEIPSFFNAALGVDIKSDGQISAIPYLLMWIASFPLAYIADLLIRKKLMTISVSRKMWNNFGQTMNGLILILFPFIAEYRSHLLTFITCTVATMLNTCVLFGFNINHIDIAPNFSSILMGFSNGAANITSILGPLFVGLVVKNEENISEWRPVFLMSAGFYITGSLMFTIFGSGTVQPWNEQKKRDSNGDIVDTKTPENEMENIRITVNNLNPSNIRNDFCEE